jgi:hypothetical protein
MPCSNCGKKVSKQNSEEKRPEFTDTLLEFLGLEAGAFSFKFKFQYRQNRFWFYLGVKNNTTGEQKAVYLGQS